MLKIALKLTSFLLLISFQLFSQEINQNRKKNTAVRVTTAPKIDGLLNDDIWANVEPSKNFVMMRPDNGKAEQNGYESEVKLVYDDNAIYVSAMMYTPNANKIPQEFVNRDNVGNADFFMVLINPNDDGQNPFAFGVTAAGVQFDFKVSNGNNEDWNWSAVWKSAHKITDKGWIVEMKIPYRALRFANESIQSWGMNFHREIRNINARYTWNHIDNTVGSWTQYDGLIEDFKDIKPPTRLTFYPYASATAVNFEGNTDFDWSVGMDVKYGLTENFTLDATLIPDFSQVGFDNVQLNLGPFEQQFSEQRQFFTEGTELFNKGRLFYSRRIGAEPIKSIEIDEDKETIIDEPAKVQMLNAVKISGRTKNGLGIGFFNAITDKTEAKIQNNTTREIRTETTNPFSNYNILVLDKQFNQNSSITLINTNVTRVGDFRDANATGLLWHVEDKKSTYNIDGSFKMTNISDDPNQPNTGYSFDTSIGRHSGKWRWEIGYQLENKDYNPNDLGILFSNNEQGVYGFLGYRLLKPKGIFNNYGINLFYNVNFLHHSGTYTGANTSLSFWANTKNRFSFGGNINLNAQEKDFFEPREGSTSGIFFRRPFRININHWASSDYRKKLAIDYNWYYTFFRNISKEAYGFRIGPRYRFNNQFSVSYSFRFNNVNNDLSYVDNINDAIIFGERDRRTYDNSLSGKYSFSNTSSLSLTFRHNWTKVPYKDDFFALNTQNGNLENSNHKDIYDVNFNNWNLDLNYIWQFAPGSQLIAFYRNSIFSRTDVTDVNFTENINNLLNDSHQHTFSVRLVYFIDYNDVKKLL